MNISSVAADTGSAAQELTTAAEYQRRAGRRAACLMLILAVVVSVVLLAVSWAITIHAQRLMFRALDSVMTQLYLYPAKPCKQRTALPHRLHVCIPFP
jgi:SNARE domain